MRVIILSQLLVLLITIIILECDARSTRVTAQYTVASEGGGNDDRTFKEKGIVEDASATQDSRLSSKFSPKQTRRGQRKKVPTQPSPSISLSSSSSTSSLSSSRDYEQPSFQPPEIFAVKGKVYDDIVTISTKSPVQNNGGGSKIHPTRGRASSSTLQTKTTPIAYVAPIKHHTQQSSSAGNSFRYPSILNEEVFQKNLQEAPSNVDTKKYKVTENPDSIYSYSTIKFSGDDEAKYFTAKKNTKSKPPRSTASFNIEQSFGTQQTQYDSTVNHGNDESNSGGFRPSSQFQNPSIKSSFKKHSSQTLPPSGGKLFKSTEDEFKESEFFDFSIRPRPGLTSSKFSSDLSVKSLAIKPHRNKFDPAPLQHGFKPSGGNNVNNFKLKDIPTINGPNVGHGIASPGQIKTFYDAVDTERDERYKSKLINDPNPASKAQLQQFFRAKEDERLERLVEEQFKLQQQKNIAMEKEAELKAQKVFLRQQKEKLKHAERQLNQRVNRQSSRQKRRPPHPQAAHLRRHRNPHPSTYLTPSSPINFSVAGNGKGPMPLRTINGKDGSYRVSFNL